MGTTQKIKKIRTRQKSKWAKKKGYVWNRREVSYIKYFDKKANNGKGFLVEKKQLHQWVSLHKQPRKETY